MVLLNKVKPFKNIGPGAHIQELMEIRGWNQQDLADVLGVSPKHINKLLNDEQAITLNMAKLLGEAFGLSPQYWINIDTNYRLRLTETSEEESYVDIRSKIYQYMPINEMYRKKWLKKPKSTEELIELVSQFWRTEKIEFDHLEKNLNLNFRKSDAYDQYNPYAAICWYQMAKNTAEQQDVPAYDKEKLNNISSNLHKFTRRNDGVSKVIRTINEAGVRFLVLSHLQKTYIDGASFIYQGSPVIVYTARYDRNDNFWFTLAHEMAHVLKHLKKEGDHFFDDTNLKESVENRLELEANQLAGSWLLHKNILDFFENDVSYVTQQQIEKCSKMLDLHTAIIIGVLAYHKKISFKYMHKFTEKVKPQIPLKYFIESVKD